jgi:hypothetical protein
MAKHEKPMNVNREIARALALSRLFSASAIVLLLWTAQGIAAEGVSMQFDNAFSVVVPSDWEMTVDNFKEHIPKELTAVFDGADAGETNLKIVGWKGEGRDKFAAAYAVIHAANVPKFNALMKAASSEERKRIAAQFADMVAQKVQTEYAVRRGMEVSDSGVEVLDAGPMIVVLADALIKDGAFLRTRSATIFFHGDSLLQIVSLYDISNPDLGAQVEEIATSVTWMKDK